jgi:tRNA threonylcarbamoyladenosine biosynthesis protein TsaE
MNSAIWPADNEAGTAALGARLASVLPPGSVVALNGPLGAGKTRLVQAAAAALGTPPGEVTSPTFVLINEYRGAMPIYHFDAYRLKDDDEFLALGPEEYFEGPGLSFVEWAERIEQCLPAERLEIRIEVTGPSSRVFNITGLGRRYEAIVALLAEAR